MFRNIIGILALMLFLSTCSDSNFTILQQDQDARMQFHPLDIAHDVRRGPELGILLRARVEDKEASPDPFHVRFVWMDTEGVVLESNRYVPTIRDTPVLNALGEETGYYEPSVVMAEAPMVRFDAGDGNYPAIVECFLPYHWLKASPGKQSFNLRIEAVKGALQGDPVKDYAGVWEASQEENVWGSIRLGLEVEWPKIYATRLRVMSMALDDKAFDPHQVDFSLNASDPQHGYPDLYWTLGLGYEQVFSSKYWPNSLEAEWKTGTPVIYVRRRDEEVSLCAMDWDNDRLFNNTHDPIGCWEGRLVQISTDTTQPLTLSFGQVREMKVVLEWLEE